MKTSDLLKRAEDFLWDGKGTVTAKEKTMCAALVFATCGQGPEAQPARLRAHDAIARPLGDHVIYSGWAIKHGYLPWDWRLDSKTWYPILQANRLNWLRELQKQFKLKGD